MAFNKKAAAGVSHLILFISAILVAAIAAAVLVQTANHLQNTALRTGERAKEEISTMVETITLYATDGTDGDLEFWYQTVRVSPGSTGLKFNGTEIEFLWGDSSVTLDYNGENCSNTSIGSGFGQGFYTDVSTGRGVYGIEYKSESTNHKSGYMQSGDIVNICYQSPGSLGQDEAVMISFVPSQGVPIILETATPDVVTGQRVSIYP